jgi:N-acetylmuramoyl-L-alanine amidase
MALKTTLNYSPNFNLVKRKEKKINFIIFHYTGMKKESAAINRLTNIQSEVSSHYLIKYSGEIVALVPELYSAWHAGKSSWRGYKSLNNTSIGIEISNPGHEFKYKKFPKKQINSLIRLTRYLIGKYDLDPKNILGHSDIAPERKKDPGEKFPWKLFAKKKISVWQNLNIVDLKKNRRIKINSSDKLLFFKNIYKLGYSNKIPKNIKKDKYQDFIIKAFQRRFRQELINGKTDKECLFISQNLVKKYC